MKSSEEESEQKQTPFLPVRIACEDGKRWNGFVGSVEEEGVVVWEEE